MVEKSQSFVQITENTHRSPSYVFLNKNFAKLLPFSSQSLQTSHACYSYSSTLANFLGCPLWQLSRFPVMNNLIRFKLFRNDLENFPDWCVATVLFFKSLLVSLFFDVVLTHTWMLQTSKPPAFCFYGGTHTCWWSVNQVYLFISRWLLLTEGLPG